jgi:hypothetical protein
MKKIMLLILLPFFIITESYAKPMPRMSDEEAQRVGNMLAIAGSLYFFIPSAAAIAAGYCMSKTNSAILQELAIMPKIFGTLIAVPTGLMLLTSIAKELKWCYRDYKNGQKN